MIAERLGRVIGGRSAPRETRAGGLFPTVAEALGIDARPLDVRETRAGFHASAEGIRRTVYDIAEVGSRVNLLRRIVAPTGAQRSTYIRLSPDEVAMPDDVMQCVAAATATPDVQDAAVFLNTDLGGVRIGLLAAVRASGRWFAIARWTSTWHDARLARSSVSDI